MEPNAEIVRQVAANISVFFRPYLSVTLPEIIHPNIVPSNADETTQPNMLAVNSNWDSRKELQPDIIAVS